MKGCARELKIAPQFFQNIHAKILCKNFKKKWLKINKNGESYFDFNGILFPDISNHTGFYLFVSRIFDDIFQIPCFYHDNFDKKIVTFLDSCLDEGAYCYKDNSFDVTVKEGNVVIDAGAWFGDFSAYTASKGAITYAFEPVEENFNMLCKTKGFYNDTIYPVQKGLSDNEGEMQITINPTNSGSNSFVFTNLGGSEKIVITTLDKFVEENNIEKIDFIKADIEGAEKYLLKGATNVLKTFAPKLALCTYHFPDDPEVLEKLIKEINPNYTVVHIRKKLFACVVE
jgi:FkbM family methyltransferase